MLPRRRQCRQPQTISLTPPLQQPMAREHKQAPQPPRRWPLYPRLPQLLPKPKPVSLPTALPAPPMPCLAQCPARHLDPLTARQVLRLAPPRERHPAPIPGTTAGTTPGTPGKTGSGDGPGAADAGGAAQGNAGKLLLSQAKVLNLPPSERAALQQGVTEKYPPEYAAKVEQYRRNLADEGSKH